MSINRPLKHLTVANTIRNMINGGRYKPGDRLPSEEELCSICGCSRGPVRQALQALALEGYITPRKGVGTFVTERGKRKPRSNIAVIAANLANAEVARLVHTISMRAAQSRIHISLLITNHTEKIEADLIDDLATKEVHGVLRIPTVLGFEREARNRLREYGIPFVVLNDFWTDCRTDHHVAFDEVAAIEMAVDHLVDLGHERIGLVDTIGKAIRLRAINTWRDALRRRGLESPESMILLTDPLTPPDLRQLYYKGGPNPTGLIALYDVMAVNVIIALRKVGLDVPEQVSVVNINGPALNMEGGVDLTTAVPRNEEIVAKAFGILMDCPADGPPQHYIIKPDFHVGTTTAPCRRQFDGALLRKAETVRPGLGKEVTRANAE